MARMRRIGVLFSAQLHAIAMACVGLLLGVLYSVGGAIYELITGTLNSGTILAFGALILMPLTFAAAGFVVGGIVGILYNLTARWTGGIELDVEAD